MHIPDSTDLASCPVRLLALLDAGYLVLDNMHIKKNILDTLELPLALRHGIIGRLEIQIPWKKLTKDPIIVAVDRVSKRN